jgi:hypothetical protein
VIWKKRLDLVDSKGVDFFGSVKETAKRLQNTENMGFTAEAQRTRSWKRLAGRVV